MDDKTQMISEWRANKREMFRVQLREFKGHLLIDLRRWYRDARGKFCPGKGISIKPNDLQLLRKALRKTSRKLKRQGAQ